ncbi:MAG: hypothetical protein M3N22_05190, partial [Acidobacteriota bacterium]|nr:hypothetical protein [Acidobacteriota bacterium]
MNRPFTALRRPDLQQLFPVLLLLCVATLVTNPLHAQEREQGPMDAPAEHHVSRIGTESAPPAPPSLPP